MSNSQPRRNIVSSNVPSDNSLLFGARGLSRLIGSVEARVQHKVCMARGVAVEIWEMMLGGSGSMEMVLSM